MEKPLMQIRAIVNRSDRRLAEKETEKQVKDVLKVEEKFYEMLFDSRYSYGILYRWLRWSMLSVREWHIRRNKQYIVINRDYHINLQPMEQEEILSERHRKILETIRNKFN